MQHFFVNENQIRDNIIEIIGDDVNHIKNVLRCKINEQIEITNIDKENKYLVKIINIDSKIITCEIIQELNNNCESNIILNIFQSLPKSDKMEFIIQKCTELGVKEIIPLISERCIVKLDKKDIDKKTTRWKSIALSAAKQSGRNYITKINNIYNIKDISEIVKNYDFIFVAYENEKENSLKDLINSIKFKNLQQELSFAVQNNFNNDLLNTNTTNEKALKIGIIIGPEGGFTENEIMFLNNLNIKSVSLGNRILRTETVAIVLSSVIMYELGDFGEL